MSTIFIFSVKIAIAWFFQSTSTVEGCPFKAKLISSMAMTVWPSWKKSQALSSKDHLNLSPWLCNSDNAVENFRGALPLLPLLFPVPLASILLPYRGIQLLPTHSYSSLDLASFLPLSLSGLPCPGLRELHHHHQVRDKIPFHPWNMCCIWPSFHKKHSASHSAPDQMERQSLVNTRLCSHKKQGQIFWDFSHQNQCHVKYLCRG